MRGFTSNLALMSLCWASWLASALSAQTLNGRWSGSFEVDGKLSALRVDIDEHPSGMRLSVREARAGNPISAARVVVNRPQIRFELGTGPSKRAFEGHLRGETISGVRTSAGLQGPFHLRREARRNPEAYDEYVGPYEFDNGRFVFIARSDTLTKESPHVAEESRLYYVNESGSTRFLYHASDSSFYSGPSIIISAPTEVEVSFTRNSDGVVSGLKWKSGDGPETIALRSDVYREEEVVFQSGDVRLAGRLLVPSGDGPHPGVVVVSGGNGHPVNRNGWYQIVGDIFARNGIASLIYDKRGGGKSSGDWWTAGPEESAADALAAVNFLRQRQEIDSEKVGLWGISEFGWFGPLAASRDEKLAFLVMVSTATRGRFESNMSWVEEQWLPSAGFTPQEIREAMEFTAIEHEFARGGIGWEKLAGAFERSKSKKWFRTSQMGSRGVTSSDDRFWLWYGLWADSDPTSALRKITCPVLAIWGETEARGNRAVMENLFRESNLRDYTIKVFPQGGHILFLESEYGRLESVKTYVPGYFQTMTDWILRRVE